MSVEAAFSTNQPPFVELSLTFARLRRRLLELQARLQDSYINLKKKTNTKKIMSAGVFLTGKAVVHSLTPTGDAGANA